MTSPFIGRLDELALLESGFDAAVRGNGGLSFLAGEPGIGKTRLAEQFAAAAGERGARVVWGRCWQGGGAPPLWPWTQVMRTLLRDPLDSDVAAQLEWTREPLQQLIDSATAQDEAAPRDTEQARFRLFDAAVSFLHAHARPRPLVLILDDLHDADGPSLLLLQFLARDLRNMPVFVVGTYRDAEVRLSPALSSAFAVLARESRRSLLTGLDREQVGSYIDALSNGRLESSVKDAVCDATSGNPFYVDEVVQVLLAAPETARSHVTLAIPDTVREAIRQRVSPLSEDAREMLRAAAVFSREIERVSLQRLLALPGDTCVRLLRECEAAGLILAATSETWRFSHGLVRDTLLDDIDIARRRGLHSKVAEHLQADRLAGHSVPAAVLAHHLVEAFPLRRAEAVAELLRAAREASSHFAYENAARHLARAIDLREEDGADYDELCALLLDLGTARRFAGDYASARETFQRVLALVRPHRENVAAQSLFARSVLGFGRVAETGAFNHELVTLLEEALEIVGPEASALRSSLLARLAMAYYFTPQAERRRALSESAVAMAEAVDDGPALINALVAHHFVIWEPGTAAERCAVADRVIELCARTGETELDLEARAWRIGDLVEMGRIAEADKEQSRYLQLAETSRLPLHRGNALRLRSSAALLAGNFELSEALADEAVALGVRTDHPNARVFHLVQAFERRWLQGRLSELEPAFRSVSDALPAMPIWRICLVASLIAAGRIEEARREYDVLALDGFAGVPRDGNWMPALTILAQTCVAFGDAAGARRLHDLLAPFADQVVVTAAAIRVSGPVSFFLGLLASVFEDFELATRHLTDAAERCQRYGYVPLLAETKRELARIDALAAARAQQPLPSAPQSPAAAVTTAGVGAVAADAASFRREGDYWRVGIVATSVNIVDMKGMRYIHHLLENAGREFHVFDLTAAVEGVAADPTAPSAFDGSDAGEVLDRQAIDEYKERLRDCAEALAEAEANNDTGRADLLRAEIDFVTREVTSAVGLGGRLRRVGAPAEQARVRINKVISFALKRIAAADPVAGRALSAGVRTGIFCVYEPDPDRPLRWLTR